MVEKRRSQNEGCVYSIERNNEAIDVLRERLSLFSKPDAIKILNLENLESSTNIPDKTIDFILVFDVLQYIKDWDTLFSYFSRVLKTKGNICIYPASVPHPGDVDIDIAKTKMEKVGIRFIKSIKYKMMHNIDMVDDFVYIFELN